jgi:hypothetical protein
MRALQEHTETSVGQKPTEVSFFVIPDGSYSRQKLM